MRQSNRFIKRISHHVTGRMICTFVGLVSVLILLSIFISAIYTTKVVYKSYGDMLNMFFENQVENVDDTLWRFSLASDLLISSENDFLRLIREPEPDHLLRIHNFTDARSIFQSNMDISLNDVTKTYKATLFLNPSAAVYNVCPEGNFPSIDKFRNGIFGIEEFTDPEIYNKIMHANGDCVWFEGKGDTICAGRRLLAYERVGETARIFDVGIVVVALGIEDINVELSENSTIESAQIQFMDENQNVIYCNTDDAIYAEEDCVQYDYALRSGLQAKVLVPKTYMDKYAYNHVFIIILISILFILIGATTIVIVSKTITKPIVALSDHIGTMQNIEKIEYAFKYEDEIEHIYFNYNTMVEKINNIFAQLEQSNKMQKAMELRLLQSQINPHFIYNALDNVNCRLLMMGEFDVANKISDLVNYMRYNIQNPQELTSLEKEAEMLRNYIGVFWLQYGDRIVLEIHIPREAREYKIPKLLIQPLVENAVMHGIGSVENADTLLVCVDVKTTEEKLIINVTDSGQCQDIDAINAHIRGEINISKKRGYGTKNVDERIRMTFGDEYGLTYKRNENNETVAEIILPVPRQGGKEQI